MVWLDTEEKIIWARSKTCNCVGCRILHWFEIQRKHMFIIKPCSNNWLNISTCEENTYKTIMLTFSWILSEVGYNLKWIRVISILPGGRTAVSPDCSAYSLSIIHACPCLFFSTITTPTWYLLFAHSKKTTDVDHLLTTNSRPFCRMQGFRTVLNVQFLSSSLILNQQASSTGQNSLCLCQLGWICTARFCWQHRGAVT